MKRCPYCGSPVEFEDYDEEFVNFEDCGDCVVATGYFDCQCGEHLKIRATFVYNDDYEIS